MNASVHLRDVSVSFADLAVLDRVTLTVSPRQRWGVVGPNGVGKSTLLRVIAGLQPIDRGVIECAPRTAIVGLLAQERERRNDETTRDMIARRTGVSGAQVALDAAADALAGGESDAPDRYGDALERWLALGCADFDSRIDEVCGRVGLSGRVLDSPTATLSGGEAARAGLAALLASRFDVYLLDEPTNDLDLAGLAELERWVLGLAAATVIVSHDREFLARTVTHVAEIDEHARTLSTFAGGWLAFLDEREVARQHARERYEQFDSQRSTLLARAQREREWATQGVSKAKKKPDDNDKHVRSFKINQTEQLAGKAARTDKLLERLTVVEEPRSTWELRLTLTEAPRSGAIVASLSDVEVHNGSFSLGPVSLTIGFGERIALVGPNGAGKTTLLGEIRARLGPSVKLGEIEQLRTQLTGDATLLDAFMRASGFTVPDARTLLAKFGLGAGDVTRPTGSLSPGERTRAALALLQAVGTNCLVLDEPTNHLDLAAIEQLEQALESFGGTVILVTHDRQMLERVRLTRRIRLEGGRVVEDMPV